MTGLIITIITGLSSGAVIAGAVFAFISVVGVIPRLAQKSGSQEKYMLYEQMVILGGIFGSVLTFFEFGIKLWWLVMAFLGLCGGIFFGCLAVSLAEVIDVIPITTRRINMKNGLSLLILSIAFGKAIGALAYFLIPGFYEL